MSSFLVRHNHFMLIRASTIYIFRIVHKIHNIFVAADLKKIVLFLQINNREKYANIFHITNIYILLLSQNYTEIYLTIKHVISMCYNKFLKYS